MQKIHLVTVGKLKIAHWHDAAKTYEKRLERAFSYTESIVKDGKASLSPKERIEAEGQSIIKAIKNKDCIICLDENGESLTSLQLANFIQEKFDQGIALTFIIGGAYGLSAEVKNMASKTLSLSSMTFPHEMAKVILLEQLYRADAILRNSPYHHA